MRPRPIPRKTPVTAQTAQSPSGFNEAAADTAENATRYGMGSETVYFASMRPRPIPRKTTAPARRSAGQWPRFNEAAADTAENAAGRSSTPCTGTGFNEAAADTAENGAGGRNRPGEVKMLQ